MSNAIERRRATSMVSEPGEPTLRRVVAFLAPILRRLTRQQWHHQDRIPTSGGLVLAANHVSNYDPLPVAHFIVYGGRWPRYLGKASLFRIPVFGRFITACGQIPVERGGRDAYRALEAAVDAVRAGKAITIYPEGTITADPDGWPMTGKSGAARVALTTGCPIVPIGQWGAQDVMPGKKPSFPRFLPRKTMRLSAGPPVDLDDLREQPVTRAVLAEATDRVMAAITAQVEFLRGESAPLERFDLRTWRERHPHHQARRGDTATGEDSSQENAG